VVVTSGPDVEVLGWLRQAGPGEDGEDGGSTPVLVRQGNVLASVFHPELTPDRRVHRLFADMCGELRC
jgi:5'-phosphate synthase pdxT subunit